MSQMLIYLEKNHQLIRYISTYLKNEQTKFILEGIVNCTSSIKMPLTVSSAA